MRLIHFDLRTRICSLSVFFIQSKITDKDIELIELERVDMALARIAATIRPRIGVGIFSMIYFEKKDFLNPGIKDLMHQENRFGGPIKEGINL